MPFYPAAVRDVHPASAQASAVACRCCPGGVSRSTRGRLYPSDMSEAEWAALIGRELCRAGADGLGPLALGL